MTVDLLALSVHTARRLGEVGGLVGAVGALVLIAAFAVRGRSAAGQLSGVLGSLLVAIAFALVIVSLHYGG